MPASSHIRCITVIHGLKLDDERWFKPHFHDEKSETFMVKSLDPQLSMVKPMWNHQFSWCITSWFQLWPPRIARSLLWMKHFTWNIPWGPMAPWNLWSRTFQGFYGLGTWLSNTLPIFWIDFWMIGYAETCLELSFGEPWRINYRYGYDREWRYARRRLG